MEFTLTTTLNARAKEVYDAWLNSESHSEMTGGEAEIHNAVGASFSAWDGYIEGRNIALDANKRIVQSWRTSEFEEGEEDSRIEILFEESNDQTNLTLIHTNLSENGEQYINGWKEHYFAPMQEYFNGN
ncbi:SRPBCC domain-containing protein [Crocinitomicaceae bacterium]|nr:SRPBCC domain-containing protein [Crocinitomicaceae bacterium]MDB3906562.1 SRPBCC domain-containing protein [Crocinitomicaceae bacterium]